MPAAFRLDGVDIGNEAVQLQCHSEDFGVVRVVMGLDGEVEVEVGLGIGPEQDEIVTERNVSVASNAVLSCSLGRRWWCSLQKRKV